MAGSPKKRMRKMMAAAAVAAGAGNGQRSDCGDNCEDALALSPSRGRQADGGTAPAPCSGGCGAEEHGEDVSAAGSDMNDGAVRGSDASANAEPGVGAADAAGERGNGNSIFDTADEFRKAADAYFADCDARGALYGEAGLCLWLSRHNHGGRRVTLDTLRRWYDGERCAYLQEDVQMAYLRIQEQVETDPRYQAKAQVSRAIFLLKQQRLGGYQDKIEEKSDTTVRIIVGDGVDAESFG